MKPNIPSRLAEAAKNYIHSDKFESPYGHGMIEVKKAFIDGAKWQAERMYSEEEVLALLEKGYHSHYNSLSIEEWFKQFKKNNGK
jgi:hypothetical protein